MVTIATAPAAQTLVLHNVSWATYEALLADHTGSSAPRFTYDQGELEILSPTTEHERDNRTLSSLVEIVADELAIDVLNVGSMTFKREDLRKGFEPDSCFYIRHEADVFGKRQIDTTVDPPPDLVIEIEVSHPALAKLPIYAQLGVPEIWRVGRRRVAVLLLDPDTGAYADSAVSKALPLLSADALTRLLADSSSLKRTAWTRAVRDWVRGQDWQPPAGGAR